MVGENAHVFSRFPKIELSVAVIKAFPFSRDCDLHTGSRHTFPNQPKRNSQLVYNLNVHVRLHICVLEAVKDMFLL